MTSLSLQPPPEPPASPLRARGIWGGAIAWTLLAVVLGITGVGARLDSYRGIVLAAAGVRLNAVKDTVSISVGRSVSPASKTKMSLRCVVVPGMCRYSPCGPLSGAGRCRA